MRGRRRYKRAEQLRALKFSCSFTFNYRSTIKWSRRTPSLMLLLPLITSFLRQSVREVKIEKGESLESRKVKVLWAIKSYLFVYLLLHSWGVCLLEHRPDNDNLWRSLLPRIIPPTNSSPDERKLLSSSRNLNFARFLERKLVLWHRRALEIVLKSELFHLAPPLRFALSGGA